MDQMNFAFRFNLQKCGCDAENIPPSILAAVLELTEEEVKEELAAAERTLGLAAERIKAKYGPLRWNKRILFLGDSLTSDRLSFAHILQKALPAECIDASVSGSSSTVFAASVNYLLERHDAEAVHIMLGTNDIPAVGRERPVNIVSLEEYRKNMTCILDCIGSKRRVILSTIPPVHSERCRVFLPNKVISNEVIKKYNRALKELAGDRNIIVNDTWGYLYETEELYEPDGVHLSPKAQEIVAEQLINILTQEESHE